ncbi:MAG TPA: YusW family protein [Bacillus sp. (in: firmicutes)]|uniref:YusW family protein n=1 Tax=Bacillus litorisediminis TaxID=2922713 RepID=UPI001FACF1D9|nr:YusW family protein [Bacillus litorisediminis]HWO78283.1 YusW family protein [Bacillus sp. (in: firmicutes)]
MPKILQLFILLFVITSCEAQEQAPPPPITEQNQGIQAKQNPFPYSFFELDVKYHGIDDKLLAQYRYMDDEIYANYSDHDKNTEQDGKEAYQFLKPKLKGLSLTKETNAEQLMTRLFAHFPIREDFRLVEVKVRFNDGEEKVFKRFHDEG